MYNTNVHLGFIPSFREAMTTREPTMLVSKDGTLPKTLLEGIEWRGFGEPCREAIIFPVRPTNGDSVVGFLLLGINPRRPYDDDYKSFVQLLDRQLATSLASVILFEDEIRRGRTAAEAAALERQQLSEQVEVQTRRLQNMAEFSPVGMFYMDSDGLLLEANERYYTMTGHAKGAQNIFNMSWMDVLAEDQHPKMNTGWDVLTIEGKPWSGELKLKRPWISSSGEVRDYWILAAAHPEFGSGGKITSIMGSITDISSQKHSSEEALTRARLSEELALRTQEAAKSERNFKRFSDLAPGGLIVMDPGGNVTYANPQWFEITGHPLERSQSGPLSWANVVHPDSLDAAEGKWGELYKSHTAFTVELRMNKPWTAPNGAVNDGETWILISASPEITSGGTLLGTMACITDISHIKWVEGLQNRRLEEAEATRRQQNNFIDIVSHEMRNPIGAILGCADDISAALVEYQSTSAKSTSLLAKLVSDCAESAETIALCAQHQKSIVDDILTISKLDSDLLLITPTTVQPTVVARRALKMFDAEVQKKDIKLDFTILKSYHNLEVDWVVLDPSRLLQILINLMTNVSVSLFYCYVTRRLKPVKSYNQNVPCLQNLSTGQHLLMTDMSNRPSNLPKQKPHVQLHFELLHLTMFLQNFFQNFDIFLPKTRDRSKDGAVEMIGVQASYSFYISKYKTVDAASPKTRRNSSSNGSPRLLQGHTPSTEAVV
jgi:PAS domain S-box-containing protein